MSFGRTPSLLVFCFLAIVLTVGETQGSLRPVTNEDIRDAIISMLHMIRSTEDKLERHEYRERLLGDQLKKALSTIEKRQRLMDPIKGTLGRLDERLATVETILMQNKDDSRTEKIDKTFNMIEQIHLSLPGLFETLKTDIVTFFPKDEPELRATLVPLDAPSKMDLQALKKEIERKIDNASAEAFKTIQSQLTEIRENSKENNVLQQNTVENLENVKQRINSSELALVKYESTLAEFNNVIDVLPTNVKVQTEMQYSLLQILNDQKRQFDELYLIVQNLTDKVEALPRISNLEETHNETLRSLQNVREEVIKQTDKTTSVLDDKLSQLQNESIINRDDIVKSIVTVGEVTEGLTANIASSFEQLNLGVKDLTRIEKTISQTSDGILDTKRRVEYGVHQIVLDLGNIIKEHTKSINASIKERFDNFELIILDAENGALANLTDKISGDIDQVWRQIGIMHQQISANSETLNKLENETSEFVNGTSSKVDAMKGKINNITRRMLEVDENLNYLLGRLSLVTQEFNQIKTGLGQALDDIKTSFHIVQNKIQDEGPGPHKIPSNEVIESPGKN